MGHLDRHTNRREFSLILRRGHSAGELAPASLQPGSVPSPATVASRPLVVMSYNIQGHAARSRKQHVDLVADLIRELRPDVVGLQEVHRNTHRGGGIDQPGDIARRSGLQFFFGTSVNAWGGEYGNAVMTTGEIESATTHPLPGVGEPRSLLACTIKIAGINLNAFVAHLTAWGWFNRRERALQIEQARTVLRSSRLPFLFMGDLNASPGSAEIRALTGSGELRACCNHTDATHRHTRQHLDYIFSDHNWETVSRAVIKAGPSDHWPLVVELRHVPAASNSTVVS
jgi:endonuclease/exonuclease/phosphatase family metal-dependent hydrolase